MTSAEAKVREVARGVHVAHVPLPMKPTIVNVTLLDGGDEWALVDTGMHTDEGLATVRAVLDAVGCQPERLRKLIGTHHHPDHFGSSQALRALTGATVYLNDREYESARNYGPGERSSLRNEFYRQHGLPMDRLGSVLSPGAFWGTLYQPAVPDQGLADGDVLHVGRFEIEVITTPGHTPGHCVLYLRRERILIAGDHLLPKITPHVGAYPGGPPNPLGDFLASQRKIQPLDVALILPAHGGVFQDHRHRSHQIIHHHEYRLREMLDVVRREPLTAYDVAVRTFGLTLDSPHVVQFPATFETVAHLEHLRSLGSVERVDRDGVYAYRAA